MEKLIWKTSYSVGVEQLDDQHQQIIKLINNLIENSNEAVNSETVAEALDSLTRYAMEHLKTEERLLESHGYSDFEAHKASHKDYRLKIVELCRNTVAGQGSVPKELLEFLHFWWINHILESDMEYKDFFEQRGVN